MSTPATTAPADMPARRLVAGLAGFVAVSALGGGVELFVWPRGNAYQAIEMLRFTPFQTFVVPGLLLFFVVGGANLACALLAWRRSRGAVDATLVAGGALTVWILAEGAMMRMVHWLHVVYGALGLALLALGVWSALRSDRPRHRWVAAVTAAEALGFAVPAVAGVASSRAGLGHAQQGLVLVAAGLVEGLLLGVGQAWALPFAVHRARYALLTAAGAAVAWASILSARALAGWIAGPALAAAGLVALLALGSAQWIELRRRTPGAERWIAWTAIAWTVALPMSFAPAPFVDESTPLAVHLVLWPCAGVVMAYTMAIVTWQGVRSLLGDLAKHGPARSSGPAVASHGWARRQALRSARAPR